MILASDVFESGASVDRLLFGTLLGLDGVGPRAVRRVRRSRRCRPRLALGRTWTAIGFDPDAAPALGLRPGWRTSRCSCSWRSPPWPRSPPWARCSWAPCSCCPAAAARLLARSVPALLGWAVALALAEGVAGPLPRLLARRAAGTADRRARRGRLRHAWRSPPASRPAARRRDGVSEPRVRVEGLAAGYGGPPALRGRELRGGGRRSRSACSARTAAARRRCSAPCSASCARWPAPCA